MIMDNIGHVKKEDADEPSAYLMGYLFKEYQKLKWERKNTNINVLIVVKEVAHNIGIRKQEVGSVKNVLHISKNNLIL